VRDTKLSRSNLSNIGHLSGITEKKHEKTVSTRDL
jgi:hypothetical protein